MPGMPTLFAVTEHARRKAPNTMLIALLAYSESGPKMRHHRSQQVKRVFCLPRSFLESYYNKKDGDQATTML
jgi:predicted solute-binding protein